MKAALQTHTKAPTATSIAPAKGLLQRKCACGGSAGLTGDCEGCSNDRLKLQRSTRNAEPETLDPELETLNSGSVPPIVHEVLRSPGQPLEAQTRAFFEPRFNHDFAHVRVHTDDKASLSAMAVNALAYTVGSHIAVRKDKHSPGTETGQRLLAHELAHVVQQAVGSSGGSDAEFCAEATAQRITDSQPVNSANVGTAPVGLYRQHEEADWEKPPWLRSPSGHLKPISLQSAYRQSQERKGIFPEIPKGSPLLGEPEKSFSMLAPPKPSWVKDPTSIDLGLNAPKKTSVNQLVLDKVDAALEGVIWRLGPKTQEKVLDVVHKAIKGGESWLIGKALDATPLDSTSKSFVEKIVKGAMQVEFKP